MRTMLRHAPGDWLAEEAQAGLLKPADAMSSGSPQPRRGSRSLRRRRTDCFSAMLIWRANMLDLLGVAFDVLIAVTVLVTAVTIGLESNTAAIRRALRRRRTLAWVVGANVGIVPLAGYAIVTALPMADGPATGVLVCAICAGGPLGLKAAHLSRGDLAWAVSLIVILTLVNVGALALWSALLLPRTVAPRPAELLGAMVVLVLLPMVIGAVLRWRTRWTVDAVLPRLEICSNVTLVLAVGVALILYFDELWSTVASWAPAATVLILGVAAGTAGVLGSSQLGEIRRASTLITMNRATGIALLVVSRAYADQPGVITAIVTFGLLQTMAVIAVAIFWRQRIARPSPTG